MKSKQISSVTSHQKGLVLLEALIAILIFSIGILGAVGLQASMIKVNSDAKYRAEAAFIAEQRISRMWVDQANLNNYAETGDGTDISESSGLPNGRRFTTRDAVDLSLFTVTVTWQQPGSVEIHNVKTVARVTGG